MLRLLSLASVLLILTQAYGQQQQTCVAFERLIDSANLILGRCVKDSSCTSIFCYDGLNQSFTFYPCRGNVSLEYVTSNGINESITENTTVRIGGAETVDLTLIQTDNGVIFHAESRNGGRVESLFDMTYIPFQCNTPTSTSTARTITEVPDIGVRVGLGVGLGLPLLLIIILLVIIAPCVYKYRKDRR